MFFAYEFKTHLTDLFCPPPSQKIKIKYKILIIITQKKNLKKKEQANKKERKWKWKKWFFSQITYMYVLSYKCKSHQKSNPMKRSIKCEIKT